MVAERGPLPKGNKLLHSLLAFAQMVLSWHKNRNVATAILVLDFLRKVN